MEKENILRQVWRDRTETGVYGHKDRVGPSTGNAIMYLLAIIADLFGWYKWRLT